jgi:hypothetical protein
MNSAETNKRDPVPTMLDFSPVDVRETASNTRLYPTFLHRLLVLTNPEMAG